MIGMPSNSNSSDIKLIDFGIATEYLDKERNHIKCQELKYFEGTTAFSSYNALNFKTTSRKDDMISLYYIIVYTIQGTLPFINS